MPLISKILKSLMKTKINMLRIKLFVRNNYYNYAEYNKMFIKIHQFLIQRLEWPSN